MKVLMVCLGNICRSPLAEGIFRDKSNYRKLNIIVDSAGTSDFHVGATPDYRSIEVARKNNVDISNLTARKFAVSDFSNFDYIFVMDLNNYNELMKLTENDSQRKKIILLTEFLFPEQKIQVPDPYYGDEKDFETVYKLIEDSCEKIIEQLFL
jgi:protein-tyrosine phosphatase